MVAPVTIVGAALAAALVAQTPPPERRFDQIGINGNFIINPSCVSTRRQPALTDVEHGAEYNPILSSVTVQPNKIAVLDSRFRSKPSP